MKNNLSSFFMGVARAFDASGSFSRYEFNKILKRSDAEAIYSDWKAIGDDLHRVIEHFDEN